MKFLSALLLCLTVLGCQSGPQSPRATAFLALADTALTVDAAMRVYATAAVAGKVSPARQEQIDHAHTQYRHAMQAALRLARYDWQQPTPENVVVLAAGLLNTLKELKP